MKFKILLWLIATLYQRSIRRNNSMKEYLKDVERTIVFATEQKNVARYLKFQNQQLSSKAKEVQDADLTMRFANSAVGFKIIWAMATGKDKNAFMRAIQDKQLKVEGDPMLLVWFQKSVKHLR